MSDDTPVTRQTIQPGQTEFCLLCSCETPATAIRWWNPAIRRPPFDPHKPAPEPFETTSDDPDAIPICPECFGER